MNDFAGKVASTQSVHGYLELVYGNVVDVTDVLSKASGADSFEFLGITCGDKSAACKIGRTYCRYWNCLSHQRRRKHLGWIDDLNRFWRDGI